MKSHWENEYSTKRPDQTSWTQEVPKTSLDFIHSFNVARTANIADIGGGDSKLVDFLLDENFENITVIDISEKALERAKKRLGERAAKVKWVAADITGYQPETTFDIWHDRATFHFMTTEEQITKYLTTARQYLKPGGYAVIGTFSNNGPKKCSGLPIKQYDETALINQLNTGFQKMKCITEDHVTPFNTIQNFLFCSFKKRERPNNHRQATKRQTRK